MSYHLSAIIIASDLPYFNDVLIIMFCKKVKTCIFCICIKPNDMRFMLHVFLRKCISSSCITVTVHGITKKIYLNSFINMHLPVHYIIFIKNGLSQKNFCTLISTNFVCLYKIFFICVGFFFFKITLDFCIYCKHYKETVGFDINALKCSFDHQECCCITFIYAFPAIMYLSLYTQIINIVIP